jgi:hypothetical protein
MSVPKPIDVYDANGNITQSYKAYEKIDDRYSDIPFLDPNMDPANGDDQARIAKFKDKGVFVQFDGLVYLILIVWILYYFNESTLDIANSIIGTGVKYTDLKRISANLNHNLLTRPANQIKDRVHATLEKNSAAYRTAVSAYKTASSGISHLGTKIEKNIELGLSRSNTSLLISDDSRREFAKKHGWIAKATGISGGLSERDKIKKTFDKKLKEERKDFDLKKMQLEKDASELYHDIRNLGKTSQNALQDNPNNTDQELQSKGGNLEQQTQEGPKTIGQRTLDAGSSLKKTLSNVNYKNKLLDSLSNMVSGQDVPLDSQLYNLERDKASREKSEKDLKILEEWSKERSAAKERYQEGLKEIQEKQLSKEEGKVAAKELKSSYNKQLHEIKSKFDPASKPKSTKK